MEPSHNNFGPPTELPQPQEVGGQHMQENGPASQPETRGMQMPSAAPSPQQPDPATVLNPQSLQAAAPPQAAVPQTTAGSSNLMADDADLIEKEWVMRAKAIVMQTKDDPHTQNREMNKVKADYLKKRYNKDLKISEG